MKKILWLFNRLKSKFVPDFSFLQVYRFFGILLLLFYSTAFISMAQPSNDNIGAAQLITVSNYCSADAEFTTIGATADGVAPSCWNTAPDRNVWFTFQATSNEVNVTVRRGGVYGTVRRVNIAIFESDGTTEVACKRYIADNDDVTLGTTALVPGNWYYITVDNNYAPYAGTFTLCADDEVDYDFIEGAIEITDISDWCSADAEYTTYGATAVAGEVKPSCWDTNPDYTRWFRFTATTNMVNITVKRGPTGTIRRINAAIFESDGITPVSCNRYVNNDDSVVVGSVDLVTGNTYYLSVDNNYSGYRGSFMLCFDDQMDYDYFEGAKDVTSLINSCSNNAEFTTLGATSPASEIAPPCWNTGPDYTRWFKFVATKPAINIEVKRGGVFGTIRRVNLALYEDDGTTVLDCNRYVFNDDNVQVEYEGLTVGEWYYIAVDNNYSGYRGTFTLCLDDNVSYDYYEGALELGIIHDWSSEDAAYTTIGATGDRLAASTWNTNPDFNRWFKFTATTNNIHVEVRRGGVYGTIRRINAAIWQADGLTEVVSNRYVNNDDNVIVQSQNLIPGNVYYISVDNNYSGYRGTFSLYVNDELDYDFYEGAKDITHLINSSSAPGEYTTIGATRDMVPPPPCWNTAPDYNRWFKFQASSPGINVRVKRGGAFGTIRRINAALFEADGTTVLSCNRYVDNDDEVEVSYEGLTIGNWYYFSVDNNYSGYRGTFTLELDDEVSYDFYEGAIELTDIHNWESAPAEFTTRGATADQLPGPCWNTSPDFNRWFKFVATTPVINVEVKRGGVYGDIRRINAAIWEADGTTPVACNRYVNNDDNVSLGSKTLVPGNTYYISVDNNYAPYRGSFTLAVNDEMDYDFYEGAYEITDLNNWQSSDAEFTTIGATGDLNAASCWNTAPDYNRWFKFQAISPDVTIQVLRGGALGTILRINAALWEADGVTEIACNRYVANDDNIIISHSGLTVGNWYYISVDNNYGPYRGSFTLAVNNVSSNEFWAIADGTWDNSNTWSYTEGGPPVPAGTIPASANIVHIGGYTVTVNAADAVCAELLLDVKNNTTGLVVNGVTLQVIGKTIVANPGNNFDGFVNVSGGGAMVVNDNLEFNRNGGDNLFGLNIFDNASSVNVYQDLLFNSTAGSVTQSQITLSDASLLEVANKLILDHSGGQKIFVGTADNSNLRVLDDIELIAAAVDRIEIELTQTSTLELGRNIVRGTPAYGILDCQDNSTVVFNSADNIQVIPASAGEGTDGFTFMNVEISNSRIATPQISTEGNVIVNGDLNLLDGIIQTEAGKVLTLNSGASLTGGGINSYVEGPFEKIGNTPFTFPIGKDGLYQPVSISAPALATDGFIAEYYNEDPDATYSRSFREATLENISDVEYWTIDRTSGTSNVNVTLEWDGDGSCVGNLPTLAVAAWDGAQWADLGNASTTGDINNGTITSSGNITLASNPITFGNSYTATDFIGLAGPYCQEAIPVALTGTPTDANGIFSGPGITDNGDGTAVFDPSVAGAGTHTIIYTYSPPSGCGGFTAKDVEVLAPPTASVTGTAIICEGVPTDISMFFTGTAPWDVTYTDGTSMFNVITSANPYILSTNVPGTYEVTDIVDANGCAGTEFGSSAVITTYAQPAKPVISVVTGVPDFCLGDSVTLESPAADFYYWSNGVITQQNVIKTSGNYTVQVYNTTGCLSEVSDPFAVNAYDYPVPTLSSSDADNSICAGELVTFTAGGGSIYEFFVDGISVQGPLAIDTYPTTTLNDGETVTVEVTNVNNCTSLSAGITTSVTVDVTPPVITCPLDQVENPDVNCEFILPDYTGLAVVTDNCDTSPVVTQSPLVGSTISANTIVTLTATDIGGNTANCTFNVVLDDLIAPVALCRDIDLTLDVSGNAIIIPADVDNGSTDNCGIASMTVVPNSFTSADIGPNIVLLTVFDDNGNSATCNATVNVIDNSPPTAVCQDIDVYLDGTGNVSITGADIDGGSFDSDGIASLVANPNTFTCAEAGVNVVILTVTDNAGMSSTCNANVTVYDTISPVAIARDITAYLNASGNVTVLPADVDNGSSDACGIASFLLDIADFDCSTLGPNAVVLSVIDNNGNSSTATATVTVVDTVAPVANCRDISVVIGASGSASIVAADVDNGSNDNCSIATLSIDQNTFTCADQGIVPVTLTVIDNSGNSSQCVANVTVTSDINALVNTSSCNSVLGLASYYESTVTGGDGVYSYFWDGLDDAYNPFMEFILAFPPWILSNTTTAVRPAVSWFLPDGIFDIRLVVTDGNGCVDTTEFQINKTGLTTDNVTTNYSDACEGETVTYTVGYEADATYTWDVEEGTILSAITDTNEVDIMWNTGVSLGVVNTYILQPGPGGDCESEVVDTVSIHPIPAPSFLAPVVSVCAGSTVTYTLNSTYDIYAWTVTNGSIVSGGSNSDDFVQVVWSNTSPGNVDVAVSNVWGCASSTDVDVDIYDIAGAIDSQVNETCAGAADGEVTVSGSGGLGTHRVSINGGITFFAAPHTFTSLTAGAYTVIVADDLGCTTNVAVNIIVEDIIPPNAICQDISVQLDGSGLASITAADVDNGSNDACGIASMTIDISSFDCSQIGPNNVTLTVTDVNSNISTCVAVVTVADTVSPVMDDPAIVSVDCSTDVPLPFADYAAYTGAGNSATDNCSVDPSTFVLVSDISDGSTCPETITRTYYIEDVNGNSTTCVHEIIINDITNPTASDPLPISVDCIADVPLPNVNVVIDEADNCAGPLVVTHLSDLSDGATCPETITRTYRVADACGNFIDVFQTITVDDNTIPTMTAPLDITVECLSEVPLAYGNFTQWTAAGGTASDNCGIATATFTLVIETSSGTNCPEILTRLYQIEDNCGNIGQVSQQIIINDVTPPELTAPPVINIDCDLAIEAPVYPGLAAFTLAGGTSLDNCGVDAASFAHVGDASDGLTCPETITRTYSVADFCGNVTTIDQTIIRNDATAPTASAPSPISVECIGDVPAPDVTVVNDESDNCSGPITVTHVGDVSDGGTCPEIITRTYSVADACGNSITVDQLITVNDITPPVLAGTPADITVECDAVPAPPVVTATDNCPGPVSLNFTQTTIPGSCANSFTLLREWTASDACGNTTVYVQTITVQDIQAPIVAGALTDAVVEGCTVASAPAAVNTVAALESLAGGITVTDACSADGNITVTNSDIIAGTCPIVITRTYTLTDECGNSSTVDHIIRINDSTAPVLTLTPGNVTVECDAIPAVPAIVAIDNCDGIVPVIFTENITAGSCANSYTITRQWSATDACGNNTLHTQDITVEDTSNPTIIGLIPATPIEGCSVADAPAAATTVAQLEAMGISISDNCSADADMTVTFTDTPSGSCPITVTRAYTVTDECGNSSIVNHTISIDDSTPPSITGTIPGTPISGCGLADTPAAETDVAGLEALGIVVTDACSADADIVVTSSDASAGTCPVIVTRTYTLTDECGNFTAINHIITIDDTTNPVLIAPADLITDCISNVAPVYGSYAEWIGAGGSGSDNCGLNTSTFAFAGVSDDGNDCPKTLTRTYYIEDNCGNFTTVTQQVVINDVTPPTLTPPVQIDIECIADIPAAYISLPEFEFEGGTATDNCIIDASSFTHIGDSDDGLVNPKTITRTYRLADNCGNVSTVDQLIVIDDLSAPVISGCPADIGPLPMEAGVCGATVSWVDPVASDNCDGAIAVVRTDGTGLNSGDLFPAGTTTIIYTATDTEGNIETCSFDIIVNPDAEQPVISGCPVDIGPLPMDAGACGAIVSFVDPTAIDNCDGAIVPVRTDGSGLNSGDLFPEGTTTISYSATDAQGNVSTCSFDITVNPDAEQPVISGCPVDIGPLPMDAGACGAIVNLVDPTANDNCDGIVAVVRTDGSGLNSGDLFPEGTTTISYSATDAMGNVSTCSFDITINPDAEQPVISGCPVDIGPLPMDAGACGAIVSFVDPTANDNCDGIVAVVRTDGSGLNSGDLFPEGTTTISYSATDAMGNVSTCSFDIIVNPDAEQPVISGCPADTGPLPMDAGVCGATVTWIDPTAIDNCDGAIVPVRTDGSGLNSGDLFPAGTTTISYSATDAMGNVSTCSFDVTVNPDAEQPVISGCPADIGPLPMDAGVCGATVTWTDPTATDNCDGAIVPVRTDGSGLNSGDLFPEGTTTISYSATDARVM